MASAAQVQQAVTDTLRELHAMLDAAQREKLGVLIRLGPLTL